MRDRASLPAIEPKIDVQQSLCPNSLSNCVCLEVARAVSSLVVYISVCRSLKVLGLRIMLYTVYLETAIDFLPECLFGQEAFMVLPKNRFLQELY